MSSSSYPSLLRTMRNLCLGTIGAIAIGGSLIHLSNLRPSTPGTGKLTANMLPQPKSELPASLTQGEQTLVLAGGCFWGVEAVFEHLRGVKDVVSGYAGGSAATADYVTVSQGRSDHAEAVKITYDPAQISYGELLQVFFAVAHDPTQLNRQGPDIGTQYRSAIFFANNDAKQAAQTYIAQLNQAKIFPKPIVTKLTPLDEFYEAEEYHQNFVKNYPNHPYVRFHDLPKLEHLKTQFTALYQN